MNVRVCGPNLSDQRKGQFHVHANGCADLRKYGPTYQGRDRKGGDLNGNREMLVEDATIVKVVEAVYDNGILDEAVAEAVAERAVDHKETDEQTRAMLRNEIIDDWVSDFWFAPCVGQLPYDLADGPPHRV